MIFEWRWAWSIAARPARLSDEVEVVQAGDSEHGVVHAVALQSAVAEDLPGLHPGEDVLDAGPDLLVGSVVFLLPVGQFFAGPAAVRHHESSAGIAAVGDRHGLPDGGLAPDSSHALQSLRLPGRVWLTTTTRRVSASMTTWWLVAYR